MKNKLRKRKSVYDRDLWDGSKIYGFYHLSVDRLKHKLKHITKKDTRIKSALERALKWRCRNGKENL